jgi:hypothetical protein
MEVVIRERFKNDDEEHIQEKLNDSTTPAAETLITYIRQWPMPSRNQALARLLEVDRWNDKGQLMLEVDFKGKTYPPKAPLMLAWESYMYGDQSKQFFPMYSFPNAVKRIPENVTEDWAAEIKELFYDMSRVSFKAVRMIALGKMVKQYGISNPHTYVTWQRMVQEWEDAQKAVDAFVVTRKGWEHLTSVNIQNPKHSAKMSKVFEDILAKADEIIEPSHKAIKEQDRRLYIRQDATGARNHVKSLGKFLKKYGASNEVALHHLNDIINILEGETLANKPLTKE